MVTSAFTITFMFFMFGLSLACLAIFILALVDVLRSSTLSTAGKILWTVILFCFPLVGAVVWYFWGRTANLDKHQGYDPDQYNQYR